MDAWRGAFCKIRGFRAFAFANTLPHLFSLIAEERFATEWHTDAMKISNTEMNESGSALDK